MDKNSRAMVPPKLMQLIQETKNGKIADETKQKLKAFCDIFSYVRLDNGVVPVLCPNIGFMPEGQFEEFMDFDHFAESAGLGKYVRTRFSSEIDIAGEHILVTVIQPGVRSREVAALIKPEQN